MGPTQFRQGPPRTVHPTPPPQVQVTGEGQLQRAGQYVDTVWTCQGDQDYRETEMNLCRTCKYWGVYAGAIGYGACTNVMIGCEVNIGKQDVLQTSQRFGCPFHEEGEQKMSIFSQDEVEECAADFYKQAVLQGSLLPGDKVDIHGNIK